VSQAGAYDTFDPSPAATNSRSAKTRRTDGRMHRACEGIWTLHQRMLVLRCLRTSLVYTSIPGVRYPTAQAGGLSAPVAVCARLNLTRRGQEEATPSGAPCTGSVRVRTVGYSGVPWDGTSARSAARPAFNRRTGCASVPSGSVPPVIRAEGQFTPTGDRKGTLSGRQWTGSSAQHHHKPVPVRGERPS
jgi:hypothetical protein